MLKKTQPYATLLILLLLLAGCQSYVRRIVVSSIERIGEPVPPAPHMITTPELPDAELAVSWVGHATVLVQIDDKLFMTDPLLTDHVGMIAKRIVKPGIDPPVLKHLDFILISHLHFDHFSYGSLDELPKDGALLLPQGGLAYTPEMGFRELKELKPWETFQEDGVRITAVPVQHFSGRYGFDSRWMGKEGYTGYVIQYQGRTVFFAGDTGYNEELFREIGRRFSIDLALLPIYPGRGMGFGVHVGPLGALAILRDVAAHWMLPIHYRTVLYGSDADPMAPLKQLETAAAQQGLTDRLVVLDIGEQRELVARARPLAGPE